MSGADGAETAPEFRLGDGRLSGALAVALGALSLLAVLCFRFPELLTTPELRAIYPLGVVRAALFAAIALAVAAGALAALLTIAPAEILLGRLTSPALQAAVAAQPLLVQLAGAIVVADLFQYAIHRAFHAVPWLWRFNAIHHSSAEMDWLAGSRLHLVDVVATRAASFAPLFVLGFSERALVAYLVFVSFHAVLLHANLRLRFGPLRWIVATPEFHHWHHAVEPVDKNFAVHLPWIDRIFGSAWTPGGFPARYGLPGDPVPTGWLRQLVWPFRR